VHEPAQGAFDHPPAFDDAESLDGGVFGDDFDVDAECGAVFDDGVFEACRGIWTPLSTALIPVSARTVSNSVGYCLWVPKIG
jgi:hypothetical protein